MQISYDEWAIEALNGQLLSKQDARIILSCESIDLLRLLSAAGDVRRARFGRKVKVHQIDNIKNGWCPEDCGYCSQSRISEAPIRPYRMKDEEDIIAEARKAKQLGVHRYCIVQSGRGPNANEIQQLVKVIGRLKNEVGIGTCLSAGLVDYEKARQLKEAGLDRLNHNLNTSEAHTSKIVSTHSYQDRVSTIRAAADADLEVCSGMITGMGETDDDIIDVAYQLRDLAATSIPINFLVPIPGNPIYDFNQLTPQRCLRILCLFRFVNPGAEIRVAGGREGHLRHMQSLALYPANSLFVDGYLTSRGDAKNETYRMIEDAGFEVEGYSRAKDECTSAERFSIDGSLNILDPKTTY